MSRFTRPGVVAGASLLTAAALVTAIASGALAATLDDAPADAPVAVEAPAPAPAPEAPAPEAPAAADAPAEPAPAEPAPAEQAPAEQAPAEQVQDAAVADETPVASANPEFPNTAPVAVDDEYSTTENQSFVGSGLTSLIFNDFDPDLGKPGGGPSEVFFGTLVSQPAHGSLLSVDSDGSFFYSPDFGFSGDDTFTYVATDGRDDSNVATVTIHVIEAHEAIANPDEYITAQNTPLQVVLDDRILVNDTLDGGPLPDGSRALPQGGTAHGQLDLNDDGSFTYTPDPGFTGTDSFLYFVDATPVVSNVTTVTITVEPAVGEPGDGGDGEDGGDDLPTLPDPGTQGGPSGAPVPPGAIPAGDPVSSLAFTGAPDGLPGLLFAAILLLVGVATLLYALVNRRRFVR